MKPASALLLSLCAAPAAPPAARAQAVPPPAAPATPAVPAAPTAAGTTPRGNPAPGAVQLEVGDVVISGEQFEDNPETGLLVVTGSPRAVRGPDEVTAARFVINSRTRQFTAEGSVVIRQGTQVLRADRATYDFEQRTGTAENAHTVIDELRIDAEQIILKPGPVYQALRAHLTTCDRRHPHYSIYTRDADAIPGDRLLAKDVGIDVVGLRLVTLASYRRSLAPEEEQRSLYPSVGYSNRTGPYVAKDFDLRSRAPVWVDAQAQLNAVREPSGGIRAGTAGKLQAVGALFYRDTAENQRIRQLQVSRLPEVGLLWSENELPRPGRFLAHQVANIRRPKALDISRDWIWQGQLSTGFFRQHRGDLIRGQDSVSKTGARLLTQGQGILPTLQLGPASLNDLRLMVRQNVYDDGHTFSVFGTGIGKRFHLGKFTLGVQRFDQWTVGSTPFLFDDIELREEWRPSLGFRSRDFGFFYTARIRGQQGGLYDQIFSVTRRMHCLVPRFTYRARRRLFMVEVSIPGLSGFGKSRFEPQTQDLDDSEIATLETQPEPAKPPRK